MAPPLPTFLELLLWHKFQGLGSLDQMNNQADASWSSLLNLPVEVLP